MPKLPRFLKSPWTWIATFVAVALYAAAGFLLVPRLLSSGVRDYVASHYHRQAELGAVTFNPFTLELNVERFALPDADGAPLAGFERLYVDVKLLSLLRGRLDFAAITLDAPRARLVRRADGRINLMDLVPPPDPAPQPAAEPPRLRIDELAIRGGEASFVDKSGRTALDVALKPITFTLHNFSTRSEGNAYQFAARSTQGETLEWQGTFGFDPILESRGTFKIERVQARTVAEVAASALPVELAKGEFGLSGSYEVAERGRDLALVVRVTELLCTDVVLRAPGEQNSWVQFARIAVTGTTLDAAKQSVDVEHVLIDRPVITEWRERDGTLYLPRLVRAALTASAAPVAAPAPAPAPGSAAAGGTATRAWTLRVPDIRLTGGDLAFEDRVPARPATFHVAPFDATVGGFAIPAAGPLAVTVDAHVNDGGRVVAKGTVSFDPLTASFALDATNLGLAVLQPYVESATAMTIREGTASAKGTVTAGAGGAVGFKGDASVDGLRTVDNALEEDFVKWRSVRLLGIRAQSTPLSLRIRELQAREPYLRVIIGSNGLTNLSAVLKPHTPPPVLTPSPAAAGSTTLVATLPEAPVAAAAPPAAKGGAGGRAPPAATALPLEIGLVRIANGTMNFSDFSIKPNVVTGIEELNGTIKGLSGKPDARADIAIEGKVDRYAPVSITGQVNFLSAIAYTNVKMSFKNVELGVLSPYSGRFAGYQIDKGKLSVDLHYLVENRKLTADHRVIVNQLQLGERVESPEATHLPVKLAIALLKDRNGVIDLDLPVTGSLDDPQFRLGPIVWKVVVNLIEKAVTAPFALLGRLFGGGEELSYIDFPAGSAALDEATRGKVAGLVKALDSRPGLNVDLPQVAAPALDGAALADQKWHADLVARAARRLGAHAAEAGAVDRLLATPKDYRALLEDLYKEALGHRAEVPAPEVAKGAAPPDPTAAAIGWLEGQLKPRYTPAPADLDALGQARANAVQSALLDGTGIDPSRVFIIKTAPLPATSGPVRMQLALH